MAHPHPLVAVWELTWRCNLRCDHCLVEGGPSGRSELSTEQALALADDLAALGIQRVTLTGGEPLFRRDWHQIAQRLVDHGCQVMLSCNGHLIRGQNLERVAALVSRVAVSIDGLPQTHDRLRHGVAGSSRSSHAEVMAAIARLQAAAIEVEVITSVHPNNLHELLDIQAQLRSAGVQRWMVQLAHATGRMAQEHMLSQAQMLVLADTLSQACSDPILPPMVHHTIGWLSKEEPRLRSSGHPRQRFWRGSPCGNRMLALEPDGGVKGCPNQVGAPFVVGSVQDEPLATIWADRSRWHWLSLTAADAQGACAGCALAPVCGGGCPCVSVATTGRLFDNPWCIRAIRRMQEAG